MAFAEGLRPSAKRPSLVVVISCRVLIIKPGVDNRVTLVMVDDARNVKKVVGLISCRADRLLQQHMTA